MAPAKGNIPASTGYLVADPRKCSGCIACMLACSLAHEGVCSPSLSRIQIVQSSFVPFPQDIDIHLCRQCVNPPCIGACQTGALQVETSQGNVRTIDQTRCDGCRQCLEACPHKPARIVWHPSRQVAAKCDLCLHAPYQVEQGGVEGKQACVEACPMQALAITGKIPQQRGDTGYRVNLRNEHWQWLGFFPEETPEDKA